MSKTKQRSAKTSKPEKPEATINQSFVDGVQTMMNGINPAAPTGSSEVSSTSAPIQAAQAKITVGPKTRPRPVGVIERGSPSVAGRKKGTKNVKRDEVDVQVSRCKSCGSTQREPYSDAVVQIAAGTDVAGKPFTHVVARPTACKDCGQARRDISYENFPKLSADELQAKLVSGKRSKKR